LWKTNEKSKNKKKIFYKFFSLLQFCFDFGLNVNKMTTTIVIIIIIITIIIASASAAIVTALTKIHLYSFIEFLV